MKQKIIMIERFIEQIEDGKKYRGSFSINRKFFNYELVFTPSIPDIAHLPQEDRTGEKINQFIAVKIKSGDTEITLTKKEHHFFVILLGDLAISFYGDPQIRIANNIAGFNSDILKNITLGAKIVDACVLTPDKYEMLNAPKFGCELPPY